jgi:hypothetical protein
MAHTQVVSGMLERVVEQSKGQGCISIQDIMGVLDRRSYGPLLLLPGILAVSPIGAIPGMSILTGILILVIAGQALWGRPSPWLPRKLLDFEFTRSKFVSGVERASPWVERGERLVKTRMAFVETDVVFRIGALVCAILALSFVPLAVIPMGVAVPGTAIILFSLGWTADDGLLVLFAFVLSAVSVGLGVYLWPF